MKPNLNFCHQCIHYQIWTAPANRGPRWGKCCNKEPKLRFFEWFRIKDSDAVVRYYSDPLGFKLTEENGEWIKSDYLLNVPEDCNYMLELLMLNNKQES